ncbi:hypothetical protein I4U23_020965 [Adineta vaga]|nr:hypothetical protein I4U23_020965 [Adineta vaga]
MRYLQIRRTLYSLTGKWPKSSPIERTKEIERYWIPKLYDEHEKYQIDSKNEKKQKMYVLPMFPYPSGRLHMGHVRVYTLSDTLARYYRMRGYRVIHCMGWDAFGLPAENAAFERSEEPIEWTKKNIAYMKQQINQLACNFDWKREIATCDPNYYRWTQYIFLMLYHEGLVYQKKAAVNWDPIDQTVLADEQIDDAGRSWRSGAIVEKKFLKQWFIRTRAFTQARIPCLLIILISFALNKTNATHVAFYSTKTPYKPPSSELIIPIPPADYELVCAQIVARHGSRALEGRKYDRLTMSLWLQAKEENALTELGRQFGNDLRYFIDINDQIGRGELSGLGKLEQQGLAHRLAERLLPLFINGLLRNTSKSIQVVSSNKARSKASLEAFVQGLPPSVASLIDYELPNPILLSFHENTKYQTYFRKDRQLKSKLRSIERHPYSKIMAQNILIVPVPENELPVRLPSIENIKSASKTGISPLANAHEWMKTQCPKCGNRDAKRETDTMDTFVDSSWYFLRYLDNENTKKPFEPTIVNKLMPVDLYIGGLEHALTHLFVARFIQHFMYSKGLCTSIEPFKRFIPIGMVQGKTYKTSDGQYVTKDKVVTMDKNTIVHSLTKEPLQIDWGKMSKSKHNGIDPEEIIDKYGVDFTRLLMLSFTAFVFEDGIAEGLQNWFKIFIYLYVDLIESRTKLDSQSTLNNDEFKQIETSLREQRLHTIYTVSFYIDSFFSIASAIIELQKLTRYLRKVPANVKKQSNEYRQALCDLLVMMAPVIPCLSSELWIILQKQVKTNIDGYDLNKSLFEQNYPTLPDDYPGKINALFENTVFASMPTSRSLLSSLTTSNILQQLTDNDKESEMKVFIEKNGLKFDRLRKLGDYCATLIYERDPNIPIIEQTEPTIEKKKNIIEKEAIFLIDMNTNEVSILLEILDLEYLKPILIDRFHNIHDLASVNLNEIGVQNQDDLNKLRYALNELQQNKHSVEHYEPILSVKDSDSILTRIENETKLISSSLNLLLNSNITIPKDDGTFDVDYSLYHSQIDQIELDVKQLQTNTDDLLHQIQQQFPSIQRTTNEFMIKTNSNQLFKTSCVLVSLSVLCIGLMFYIKQK